MTNTLLLRLIGPMQSWGVQSRFTERDTLTEPSKSGVVGLLCAAQGLEREAADVFLAEFNRARVRMGVRVDREGLVRYDYHTAKDVRIAEAEKVDIQKKTGVRDSVSRRYYLADAAFLVGLESEDLALLTRLFDALATPHWPLYLGRKAFVPSEPVNLPNGLQMGKTLEDALNLKTYPPLRPPQKDRLRMILETANGEIVRPDQPLSFSQRRFAPRRVSVTFIPAPPIRNQQSAIENLEAA
jgi:CRISPR system Cascade subunit CasD